MTRWRYGPFATLLLDGRVLVAGGYISGGGVTGAEVYDPATNAWRSTRTMAEAPGSATRLADGAFSSCTAPSGAELFDPVSGRWSWAAKPPASGAQALLLESGEALVMEGNPDGIGGAELYDPTSDTWTQTGSPETGRGPATLLSRRDCPARRSGAISALRRTNRHVVGVPRPPLQRDYALTSADGVEVYVLVELADGRVLATENHSAAIFDPGTEGREKPGGSRPAGSRPTDPKLKPPA